MKNIILIGRVSEINNARSFNKKDGGVGYVGSFLLQDKTGSIRIVLWDEQAQIFSNENFKKNELVKIINGYAKDGRYGVEVHVGRLSKLELSPDDVDYKKYPKIKENLVKLGDINTDLRSLSVEGKVLQKFTVNEFIRKDGETGRVCSLIIIDSTGRTRLTFWNDDIDKINNIEAGDVISVTNLNPRNNRQDPNSIDLHSRPSTVIKKLNKKMNFETKIMENIRLLQNSNNIVSFRGVVSSIDDLKTVTLKSGDSVPLLSFVTSDATDAIKVTAWRDKAEHYSKFLKIGKGILLKNALIRYNDFSGKKEVTIIQDSNLEEIELQIPNMVKKIEPGTRDEAVRFSYNTTKINVINSSGFFEVQGYVAKEINKINIYEACPTCRRKTDNCVCDEKGTPVLNMIVNLVIDDESGTIRTAFIGKMAEKLIGEKPESINLIRETPDYERFLEKFSSEIVGKDLLIKGRAKFSEFSDSYEMTVSDFQEVNIEDELNRKIKELESNS